MAAVGLCIIGKRNDPLYIKVFEEDDALRLQFILHDALDRFEQLEGPPPGYAWRTGSGVSGADAMFVGLLQPVEELLVYGA